ncbi:MAG: DegT/DnrJ/EryC1/StrS family aminotransferase [Clostridia bacterium]|nr:DegT/DnrJ/EryC1/StrS family aminotransferase [Clostridia bacterium]
MNVPFRRLDAEFALFRDEYISAAEKVLSGGMYVNGSEVSRFEQDFAGRTGKKRCCAVNNGTDALFIALKCLGVGAGDEVIVPCNTFVADFLAVRNCGAVSVPSDADRYFCLDPAGLEKRLTPRTKGIVAVHLYGHSADMDAICNFAGKHGLFVIEDCAQAFGTTFEGRPVGSFGDAACYSFYPTKNLGAFGDAGCVCVDGDGLFEKLRVFKSYGMSGGEYVSEGVNSRMDELQAALLSVKLSHSARLLDERRTIAEKYLRGVSNPYIALPGTSPLSNHTYHQFVVMCSRRDELRRYLAGLGIETMVHYENPPWLSEIYPARGGQAELNAFSSTLHTRILSLPIFCGMTDGQIDYVIGALNDFQSNSVGGSPR